MKSKRLCPRHVGAASSRDDLRGVWGTAALPLRRTAGCKVTQILPCCLRLMRLAQGLRSRLLPLLDLTLVAQMAITASLPVMAPLWLPEPSARATSACAMEHGAFARRQSLRCLLLLQTVRVESFQEHLPSCEGVQGIWLQRICLVVIARIDACEAVALIEAESTICIHRRPRWRDNYKCLSRSWKLGHRKPHHLLRTAEGLPILACCCHHHPMIWQRRRH